MSFIRATQRLGIVLTALIAMTVSGCHEDEPNATADANAHKKLEQVLSANLDADQRDAILEGVKALKEHDYQKASQVFNSALLEDPQNSALHTLNAMTYQLRAKRGDMGANDLAEAGFTQAKLNNPNNIFACIQLGRVKVDKKDYMAAQEEFAEALLLDPTNEEALYELASASYLMGDMKTASSSVDRLLALDPERMEYSRAGALIYAALGEKGRSDQLLAAYNNGEDDNKKKHFLQQRLRDWQHLHTTGDILLAQADTTNPNFDITPADSKLTNVADSTSAPAGAAKKDKASQKKSDPADEMPQSVYENFMKDDMVVIDGVVMRVSEEGTTSKGHNILETFNLSIAPYVKMRARDVSGTIGTPTILNSFLQAPGNVPTPTFNASTGAVSAPAFGPHNKVKVSAHGLSLNTITYNLNIINVSKQFIEVIARPTLTTQIGKPAEFFAGEDIKIAIAGNFGGNVTQTPVGNTLKVTPISLENGYVTLDIELIGSLVTLTQTQLISLAVANTPIIFTVDRSNVHTTIKVKFGETIMLAGTSERVDFQTTSGVPFLDQIPGIQYLFSNQSTESERKHVMYLITPRSYKANLRETFQYFNKGEEDEICRPNLNDLERRYKNWFNPHLNHILILKGLGPVYRDFRSGDFLSLEWRQETTLEEQVTQIIEFLWF